MEVAACHHQLLQLYGNMSEVPSSQQAGNPRLPRQRYTLDLNCGACGAHHRTLRSCGPWAMPCPPLGRSTPGDGLGKAGSGGGAVPMGGACPLSVWPSSAGVRARAEPQRPHSPPSAPQCGNMAREGLRVLVVAKKSLAEEQYQDFEVSGSVTAAYSRPCPPARLPATSPPSGPSLLPLLPSCCPSWAQPGSLRSPAFALASECTELVLPRSPLPQLKCRRLREVLLDSPSEAAPPRYSPPFTPFNFLLCTYLEWPCM